MKFTTSLKRAALVAAIATSLTASANASTWNSGSASWVVGSPGWNTTQPNAPGDVADFTGITATSVATIPSATTKTVGSVTYGTNEGPS